MRGFLSATLGPCFALLALCASAQSPLGMPQAISPPGMPAYEVSLATLDDHLALAWHGGGLAHNALWLRFVDANGRARGSTLQLTDGQRDAYEPDLQPFGPGLALAWYEKDASTGALTAWLACLDGSGREQWRRSLSAAGHNGRNPVVRVAGDELLVAWIESAQGGSPGIWSARYSASGRPLGAARLAAPASANTWNLNAAVDAAGALYVVYDAALGTRAKELQLVRLAGQRIDRWPLSADDGFESAYPDIALEGDRLALTWFDSRDGNQDVYLFAGALAQLPLLLDTRATRITRTTGASFGAYLAWNGGRLALAWSDDIAGDVEVLAQHFNVDGRPLGTASQLTHGTPRSLIPSIRRWRTGFAVAWNEYTPGDGDAMHSPPRASIAELQLLR